MVSSEQDEHRRSVFREYVRSLDPRRFVFVDECSTNISLSPIYARAPKGERAHGKAPRNWGKNISLISAIGADGVKPSMTTEGAVDGLAFETYLEHFLLPALKAGQIIVMDNLSVHKSRRAKELIEQKGVALLFLPPYSPDFNPIEGVFSKLKGILRKAEARTQGVLVEAMGRALSAISRQDIAAFFAHCGYRLPLQLL